MEIVCRDIAMVTRLILGSADMQWLKREELDRELGAIHETLLGPLTQSLPHGCLLASQTDKEKRRNGEPTKNAELYGMRSDASRRKFFPTPSELEAAQILLAQLERVAGQTKGRGHAVHGQTLKADLKRRLTGPVLALVGPPEH